MKGMKHGMKQGTGMKKGYGMMMEEPMMPSPKKTGTGKKSMSKGKK